MCCQHDIVVYQHVLWHYCLSLSCVTIAKVARVPDLHLIDAVISPEEQQLLRKDGLDSCALR